jgi:oxygen-independent coproporphyrinogen-3 oxidase
MYRQSRSVGNFENVGWCRPGTEGLYNVFMMEEAHTVLACGAGAVTKLREPNGKWIERIFNFKYPYEYIGRFDELTSRKARIKTFYKEYGI